MSAAMRTPRDSSSNAAAMQEVNGAGNGEGKIENVGYKLSFKKGGGIEKGEGVSVKYESKAGAVR